MPVISQTANIGLHETHSQRTTMNIQLFELEGLIAFLTMLQDGKWTVQRANKMAER